MVPLPRPPALSPAPWSAWPSCAGRHLRDLLAAEDDQPLAPHPRRRPDRALRPRRWRRTGRCTLSARRTEAILARIRRRAGSRRSASTRPARPRPTAWCRPRFAEQPAKPDPSPAQPAQLLAAIRAMTGCVSEHADPGHPDRPVDLDQRRQGALDAGRDHAPPTLPTVLPGALFMVTGFTRTIIVLGFVRNAMGTPDQPANPGAGRDLDLPDHLRDGADVQGDERRRRSSPTLHKQITLQDSGRPRAGAAPRVSCSSRRATPTSPSSSRAPRRGPRREADIPTYVLIPAFIISRAKTAFQIGFFDPTRPS